ncbi:hypothetical protein COS31_00490 [Candidatus Roizmanbacteria bacterium CG02_land_8_20_14_3_00_36_15]|uniref:Nitroreductase domain-containing protein n=2 Tax=Candidatus Roizmaniibacteriota TaxID=1752723 RepID=A0A2M8KJS0_9BACT|nr:MAG: hypothetical protein COS51_01070 [Candidatus Roizmanbacteria bacterium CG03_land_8_20_14_0_80_36_21]PIV38224.1 MAG: hypothetical protein COS31_00490 [Candidatus Roizmanbacteria bacterium CG02_land_8_20_14_3_00_36_15]PIY70451.1 MAG: hypothetical protein COY89_00995 [Candidatus Roizmanbacteria bacterium CG_4_10_14_0_8_um_filter_36_36]PJA53708.1 MAG: hypothetical protein CO166_01005 [Candidatus Roizmanbacteria bacterium CG_4_9_14_3_um_filter_36_11]PJC81413.1 MAG: hypothetical protein CO007
MKSFIPINENGLAMILARTCCRSFNPKKAINDQIIELILKAGQAAPSAKNRQPYYFLIIKNKLCLSKIAQASYIGRRRQFADWDRKKTEIMIKGNSYLNSNDAIILQAPVTIIAFRKSDLNYQEAQPNELNIKEEQSVANACYSMLLAAWSLGIGSAWLCSPLYIKDELKAILGKYGVKWQKNWQPRTMIPLGYPLRELTKPKRKSLEEIFQNIN